MVTGRLREALDTRPFQPFIMHMTDGRGLEVRSPELLAISPSCRIAVFIGPKDSVHVIDVFMVTDIEMRPRRSPPGRNGHSRA